MFLLDVTNKLAWAVEAEEVDLGKPTARIWGVLTPNDVVPRREIRQWLAEHRIPEGRANFVPLPTGLSQLYKRPRKDIVSLEEQQVHLSPPKSDVLAASQSPQISATQHSAISLQREGGTFVIPVAINGELTLKFTIDSGAADVSIPADVVMTLLRTGTLSRADFLGTQTYRLADGSTMPSQTFRIRSLKVGDRIVENVIGSIAPVAGNLLLGQSFLSRFQSWSIDNQRQVLVLD
jgi:predicted aspartyl protease